jgi:hypothetical protein
LSSTKSLADFSTIIYRLLTSSLCPSHDRTLSICKRYWPLMVDLSYCLVVLYALSDSMKGTMEMLFVTDNFFI